MHAIVSINNWTKAHIAKGDRLLVLLSIAVGFLSGTGAAIMKNAVHFIKSLIHTNNFEDTSTGLFFLYPFIGITLTVLFVKYVIKQKVGHGIPSVLYAISKNNAYMKLHNTFSSIVTSTLTVGFGGSVGLEGPAVATGGAIGANLGKLFHLTYKQRILLLGSASAAAMSAIFKSPIAGVVFALEVIMIDLNTRSIIPILFASVSGYITSYLFLGQNVLYPFPTQDTFVIGEVPYYIFLGIITGLIAVYFTRSYVLTERLFKGIISPVKKLMIGCLLLAALIFFFPALYGEGYEVINSCLHGDVNYLFTNSVFEPLKDNVYVVILLMLAIIGLKIFATSITFNAGGIGGIFAPTLFMGANTGLLLATVSNKLNIVQITPNNSALVAMGGLIAGVLHAPLTGIFLIAEITHGYGLFFPLMLAAASSYATVKFFEKNNVYTIQLARRSELLTHHYDRNALSRMSIREIIETDFSPVKKGDNLGDLVKVVSDSKRNIFPVIDKDNNFEGIVTLDRLRKIMFKPALYTKIKVADIMEYPDITVGYNETMEHIASKIQYGDVYNAVVLEDGKYRGFVSKSNVFSKYRSLLKEMSDD